MDGAIGTYRPEAGRARGDGFDWDYGAPDGSGVAR
jgi:hypothetical protein